MNYLLPDNLAYPERLKEVPRDSAIQALTKAQETAKGDRADAISYLLVMLDSDPGPNRARLIESLRSCVRDGENCSDRVVSYLTNLVQRGDKTLLDPLLEAAKGADPTLTELLGSSYQELLVQNSGTVITAISRRPAQEQRRLCHMIAAGDGTGVPDEDAEEITSALQALTKGVGPVASTAMMCANEIRAFAPGR